MSQYVPVTSDDFSKCAPCSYSPWANSGAPEITGCNTGLQTQTRTTTDGGKGDCLLPTTQTTEVKVNDDSLCVYAPFAPANAPSYSSCNTNNNLIESENLNKFKKFVSNAISNISKNSNKCNK